MSKENPTFLDIPCGDPRHRQIIAATIKAGDTEALTKLKGNTNKPIRFVRQTFMYLLMTTSWEGNHEDEYVVIYDIEARRDLTRMAASLDLGEDQPEPNAITIPDDTYDFLL